MLHHGRDTPSTIEMLGGGSAANTACWLASTGRPVRLVAVERAGVTFAGCVVEGMSTDTCVVLVGEDGERTMLPDRTKHGPGGASWADGHRALTVPASEVAVVSTVGAGDAFDAGFIDARLRSAPTADALTAGGRLAARALAQPGARPPRPMRP